MPATTPATLPGTQRDSAHLAFLKYREHTQTFAVSTNCRSIYRSVEQIYEVAKSLPTLIFVDSQPCTAIKLSCLPQCQSDAAERTPAACIEEVGFCEFEMIRFNHRSPYSSPTCLFPQEARATIADFMPRNLSARTRSCLSICGARVEQTLRRSRRRPSAPHVPRLPIECLPGTRRPATDLAHDAAMNEPPCADR
jgi:hypothetical protein